jgi:hypothetical protein
MTKRGARSGSADGAPVMEGFSRARAIGDKGRSADPHPSISRRRLRLDPDHQAMSFSNQATVNEHARFYKDGGTIYVWFRPVNDAADFQVGSSNRSSGLRPR